MQNPLTSSPYLLEKGERRAGCFLAPTGKSNSQRCRRGLAPVEFVLALPILLFLMALMMIFGTAASWKLRTETVSRDAVWRTRFPRVQTMTPRPPAWPLDAGMAVNQGPDVTQLIEPILDQPVVAGPLQAATIEGFIVEVAVDDQVLDFSRGVRDGQASIQRDPAMLRKIGPYQFDVNNPLIEDEFRYGQMGLGWNGNRRLPRIYSISNPPASRVTLNQATSALFNSPNNWPLRALDRDDEFMLYRGRHPQFHPRMQRRCDMEVETYEETYGPNQERGIRQVPLRMARAFISLYEELLAEEPPPANAAELRLKVEQLRRFIESLREGSGDRDERPTPTPDPSA